MSEKKTEPFIVVGIDGSDHSVAALEWAVEEAKLRRARVVVVTGFDIPWTINITPTYTGNDYQRDAAEMQARALEKFHSAHPDIEIESHLIQRKPALALIESARNAELLVVGSHGYGAHPGMQLGSVATYCTHHAPCPVVVHRTGE